MSEDIGLEVVRAMRRAFGVEDQWSKDLERGFTWWPGPLAQHVWSDPPTEVRGRMCWRLHVRSDFIRNFDPVPRQLGILNLYHTHATLSALIPAFANTSRLSFATAIPISDTNLQPTVDLFARIVAIQAAEALLCAQEAPNLVDAEPDFSAHPLSGSRENYHDVLECIAKLVEPQGREASLFAGDEIKEVADELAELGARFRSDSTCLVAEIPFRDRTCLFRITCDERNPRLGNGALVLLDLPIGQDGPPETPLRFNAWEDEMTPFLMSLGSWSFSPEHGNLCHVLFLPNDCFAPGLLSKVFDDAIERSQWADVAYKHAFEV